MSVLLVGQTVQRVSPQTEPAPVVLRRSRSLTVLANVLQVHTSTQPQTLVHPTLRVKQAFTTMVRTTVYAVC